MGAIAFDLLIGGNSTKDNFSELAFVEGAICDATVQR